MPAKVAVVTTNHIRWRPPITIHFGFSGITPAEAKSLARQRLKEQFPKLDRPRYCVYVVRLKGPVAVAYGEEFSPVIYIGEGYAATRLQNHANWIAELLLAVPNAEIEVRIADCVRAGKDTNAAFCQYVEADLIDMFTRKYNCLPWFNRQREAKFRGKKTYHPDVLKEFTQRIGKVSGSRYVWAIKPTDNNSQFTSYDTGWYENAD